ncbi:MAG TPA: sensor domain-containing protein [Pseudonocardiaceae bacterium]|jgi:signal transduction histidine kinase|nr:sensor domain-containing protein [Pseudonocardiaceae bacterium]
MSAHDVPRTTGLWPVVVGRARITLDALDHVVGGLGSVVLAIAALLWLVMTAALCLVGIGVFMLPTALRGVRLVANRERTRLSRWGRKVLEPEPVPAGLPAAVRDSAVRRELCWLVCHASFGLFLALVALSLPIDVIHDTTFPVWWRLVSAASDTPAQRLWTVHDWPGAFLVCLFGLVTGVVTIAIMPTLAWLQAWPGFRLLSADRGTDLALRVAQLTATRAAALDAHAAELRRIERSLHDGTQNRIVAVNVLLGAARRAVARNPAEAEAILDRAQDAAEQALAELRGVVRSILPPVLTDRSLPDALTALAAACPVTCRIDARVPDRCAASVEATAYFVVAEALTNIARHSGAGTAAVRLRRREDRLFVEVTDDGHGGADEHGGSGLGGIRRRVEAHDGTFALASPIGGPTVLKVSLPCGS